MSRFLNTLSTPSGQPRLLMNTRVNACLASTVHVASDSRTRRRGLLGRSHLPASEALVLAPCFSIHTFFMRFAIDVVFVATDGRVLKVCPDVKPWRIRMCLSARAVVELAAGAAAIADVHRGDLLAIQPDTEKQLSK